MMKIIIRVYNETKYYDLDKFDLTNKAEQAIKETIDDVVYVESKKDINDFIKTLPKFIKFYKNYNDDYFSCNTIPYFETEVKSFKDNYEYIAKSIIIKFGKTEIVYHQDMLKVNELRFNNELDFKLLRVVILNYILKIFKELNNESRT